jgi:hypothetical protein
MNLISIFQPMLRIAGALFASWFISFAITGSANAGDVLQCKGPNQHSVVACCQRETASKRPLWMTENNLSCQQAVACGGGLRNKERCRVIVVDKQNSTRMNQSGGKRGNISDIRLKTNIHLVGTTVLNLPLYKFEYRGKSGTYIGVMAQDVLKVDPSAVSIGRDGFYRVDYQKLGIEMLQVQ